jgi:acyl-CoA thioesterase
MEILLYEGCPVGSFAADTEVHEEGGKLRATLSRDWEIRGPNGGYVASIALRAAGKVAPPDHRPATFSCQYLAAGQFADVGVEPVRKGRNAWCLNVVLMQSGKRILQAQVWTTNKSDGPRTRHRLRRQQHVPRPSDAVIGGALTWPGRALKHPGPKVRPWPRWRNW